MVIALRGAAGTGKSHTLNIVYSLLLHHGFVQIPGHFEPLYEESKDFIDILVRDDIRLGIVSLGDHLPPKHRNLSDLLTKLKNEQCDIIVCASRADSKFDEIVASFGQHIFVKKTTSEKESEQRIANGIDADAIIGYINIFTSHKVKARPYHANHS